MAGATNNATVGTGGPGATNVAGQPGAQPGTTPDQQPGTTVGSSVAGVEGANGVNASDTRVVSASGSVTLFDAPVANVTVNIYRAGEDSILSTVKTDAQGNFSSNISLGVPEGAPLRMVAVTSEGQALVGLGEASGVIATGGLNYRIAAKKRSTSVNEGTTLAIAMNPSIELLLAANFEGGTTISPEAKAGLEDTLADLATAAEAALAVLEEGTEELDATESAAALNYVLSFFGTNATTRGETTAVLPPDVVSVLTQGSQIAAGDSPNPNQVSPLEFAFSQAVQQIAAEVQAILETASDFGVEIASITFGSQTQAPIEVKPGKPTVSVGVNIVGVQDGEFKPASAPPTIVVPGALH